MPTSTPSPAGTPTATAASIPGVVRTINPDHLGHETRDVTALRRLLDTARETRSRGVIFLGCSPNSLLGLAPALKMNGINIVISSDDPSPDTRRIPNMMIVPSGTSLVELAGRFPEGAIFVTPTGPNNHLGAVHELLGLGPSDTPPPLLRAHDLAHGTSDRKRPTEPPKVEDIEPEGVDA